MTRTARRALPYRYLSSNRFIFLILLYLSIVYARSVRAVTTRRAAPASEREGSAIVQGNFEKGLGRHAFRGGNLGTLPTVRGEHRRLAL